MFFPFFYIPQNKNSYYISNENEIKKDFLDSFRIFSFLFTYIIFIFFFSFLIYFNTNINLIYQVIIFILFSISFAAFMKFYIYKKDDYILLMNILKPITSLTFASLISFGLFYLTKLDIIGTITITLFLSIYHLIIMIDTKLTYYIRNSNLFKNEIIILIFFIILASIISILTFSIRLKYLFII